jgi:hypothetical protein
MAIGLYSHIGLRQRFKFDQGDRKYLLLSRSLHNCQTRVTTTTPFSLIPTRLVDQLPTGLFDGRLASIPAVPNHLRLQKRRLKELRNIRLRRYVLRYYLNENKDGVRISIDVLYLCARARISTAIKPILFYKVVSARTVRKQLHAHGVRKVCV